MTVTEFSHFFDYSLEQVLEGREARYSNRDWWPEIISATIESEEEIIGILKKVRRIKLENKLPTGKIFKDSNYTAIETSHYDVKNSNYKIESTLESHQKLVLFLENSEYQVLEEDKSKCMRTITLKVDVKVPLLGKIAEQAISSEFKKISDKDKKTIEKYIQQNYS